jgi:hypothetical protein
MRWALEPENPHQLGVDEFGAWLDSVGEASSGSLKRRRGE